jgi:hypothetical protein
LVFLIESMNPKCPCQNCNAQLEFDAKDAGQTVPCPQCGMDTVLFIPPTQSKASTPEARTWAALAESAAASGTSLGQAGQRIEYAAEKPLSLKGQIRGKTEYATGRGIVDAVRLFSILGAVIMVFVCIGALGNVSGDRSWPFMGFGVAIANLLIALALREVAHAIFDMADCALKRQQD